jgi:hypothetical protein
MPLPLERDASTGLLGAGIARQKLRLSHNPTVTPRTQRFPGDGIAFRVAASLIEARHAAVVVP